MSKFNFFLQVLKLAFSAYYNSFKYSSKTIDKCYFKLQSYCWKLIKNSNIELIIEKDYQVSDETTLFVCNHQGTLDPIFLIASVNQAFSFISKDSNSKLPLIGRWEKLIGDINFDRDELSGNIHMLRESLAYLKDGKNLLIFPEGTRSKCDLMNDFKENALKLALMAKVRIVPITLNNAYCFDDNFKNKKVSIYFHDPIVYQDYHHLSEKQLSDKIRKIISSKIKKV